MKKLNVSKNIANSFGFSAGKKKQDGVIESQNGQESNGQPVPMNNDLALSV